ARHGLDSWRHVSHGLGRALRRGGAKPPRCGRWLLDRPDAGYEPAIQAIRDGDRPCDDSGGSARPEGLSGRTAAYALWRLAGVCATEVDLRSVRLEPVVVLHE